MAEFPCLIQASTAEEATWWDGTSWVDDPIDAATYDDDAQLQDGLIEAQRAGHPDGMRGAVIHSASVAAVLDLKEFGR